MKKFISILLVCAMMLSLAACAGTKAPKSSGDLKIGVILIGDETEGYTAAHMDGIKTAAATLGISESNIVWKYKVPESADCYDAAVDLVGQGCKLVISNSYGHQTYMVQAAQEYPDVTFVSMTGDFAALTGLNNFKNAFTNCYEGRYVSGVVAGMKLKQLMDEGTVSETATPQSFDADGNVKIGYVGAFDYAEVVSGYTAFYLGVKSIVPNVAMEVMYTDSWFDIDKEGAAAKALVANGNVIIGQHADSTGAPAAVEKLLESGTVCYSVGYNIDMIPTAPKAALTSAGNNWNVYYQFLFQQMLDGKEVAANWSEGFNQEAVKITALGESCAPGTQEKVDEVITALKNGTIHVFDTNNFTVDGAKVTTATVDLSFMDWSTMTAIYPGETVECIKDGYFTESTYRSAPYFALRIDGITEDADRVQ